MSANEVSDLGDKLNLEVGRAVLAVLRDRENAERSAVVQADGKEIMVYGPGNLSIGIQVVIAIDSVIVNH